MSPSASAWVFVVTGDASHVRALHTSLACLRRSTCREIIVVTDAARLAHTIAHDRIIDVRTPAWLNDHQAAIHLKTCLPEILPAGRRYCYLDNDVFAMDDRVDDVFEAGAPVVAFASDHVDLQTFSPHAVRCGCLERAKRQASALGRLLNRTNAAVVADQERIQRLSQEWTRLMDRPSIARPTLPARVLRSIVGRVTPSPVTDPARLARRSGAVASVAQAMRDWADRVVMADRPSYLAYLHRSGFSFHAPGGVWTDRRGRLIMYDTPRLERETGLRFEPETQIWLDADGQDVYWPRCDHLPRAIEQLFGVRVDAAWTHWNGGVFVFDQGAAPFMKTWHAFAVRTFRDPLWVTRDQGALTAAAWAHRLQDLPRLPERFNTIAYFGRPGWQFVPEGGFSRDGFRTAIRPSLLHVFDHHDDAAWPVWRWVDARAGVERHGRMSPR